MRDLWFLSKKRSFGKGAVPSFGAEVMKIMDTNDMMRQLKNLPLHASRITLHASPAFSLVEISLALLVIAVGILSVLSLFPVGLDQSARSTGDTHAALFAQEVFSGLRVQAESNWANLDTYSVVCAASDMWEHTLTNQVTGTNVMKNVYKWATYVDHAHQYRLSISTNDNITIKSAMLRVYPGEFGSVSNPLVFYTEFYKF